MQANTAADNIFLKDIELAARYKVTRQSIWRWTQKGRFPAPETLSPGCSRWRQSAVDAWEKSKAA
jgi:predicted DNA-binding transcriptional regulator AlpA